MEIAQRLARMREVQFKLFMTYAHLTMLMRIWCVLAIFCYSQTVDAAIQTAIKKVVPCTITYCPLPTVNINQNELINDQVILYETSPSGFLQRKILFFSAKKNAYWSEIKLNENSYTHTTPIIGFGGSFTDSAAILYAYLSPVLKQKLLSAYFSLQGNAYTLGRVPIASTDFSCRAEISVDSKIAVQPSLGPCSPTLSIYTYADKFDPDLSSFALQNEDIQYKIPFIKAAMQQAQQDDVSLRFFASPWSAPSWMKTNEHMIGGHLKPNYQQHWAEYFIKFLQNYNQYGIKFWAVTVQNEPADNVISRTAQRWQTMFYTPREESDFVKDALGPALHAFAKDYGNKINIIFHDDQINTIHHKMDLLRDARLAQYIDGAGLHWYWNFIWSNLGSLDKAYELLNHDQSVSRFILATEACEGYQPFAKGTHLGEWSRGESYAHDIINDLKHHVAGWMDWNLLLDLNGGPTWAKNYVDSPVLADIKNQILYFQPMYFFLSHFSRFLRPEAKQLNSLTHNIFPLEVVSYKVPAYHQLPATVVVIVLNRDHMPHKYNLVDENKIQQPYLNLTIPPHTIQTLIYRAL